MREYLTISLPVLIETTCVGMGTPSQVRWDAHATLRGEPLYLGEDVPGSRNGHFTTEHAAYTAALRAVKAWARGQVAQADTTRRAARRG